MELEAVGVSPPMAASLPFIVGGCIMGLGAVPVFFLPPDRDGWETITPTPEAPDSGTSTPARS